MPTAKKYVWEYQVTWYDESGAALNTQTVFIRDDYILDLDYLFNKAIEIANRRASDSPGLQELLGNPSDLTAVAENVSFTERP